MPAWDKRPPPRDSRVGRLIWAVPLPRDGDGSVNPPRKAIAVVLGLLLLGVSNVGMAGRAHAAQNRPSWAPGDYWGDKSTTRTTTSGLGSSSQVASYSGVVTGEVDVTVPAGTFQAAVIRSPASGNPYTLSYYSERIGDTVRTG